MKAIEPSRALQIVTQNEPLPERDRIAIATSDRLHIDQHFGTATCFLVYRFDETQYQLIKAIEYPALNKGHDVNKLTNRVAMLEGCRLVYCNAIGHSAVQQLLRKHIQPLIVEPTLIEPILQRRLHEILHTPVAPQEPQDKLNELANLLDEPW